MQKIESLNIFGVNVSKLTGKIFLESIEEKISNKEPLVIGYANADTLNKVYGNSILVNIFNSFDLIHPDGIGVYLASKFLFGSNGLEERLTGSDFYEILIKELIRQNRKCFFFGHSRDILDEIKVIHPELNIAGIHEGYIFEDSEVISKINNAQPDILIIGLSCPKQEIWIHQNRSKLTCKVILLVGDGIKVFAGKKIRGPLFLRKIGLEWMVRYLTSPVANFRKYITGVPLFMYRIMAFNPKSK